MDDHLNPRPGPSHRSHDAEERWREMQDRDYGYMGPVIAFVAALFVALLLYSVWDGGNPSGTRVGQNVERNITPDAPRNPNAPN